MKNTDWYGFSRKKYGFPPRNCGVSATVCIYTLIVIGAFPISTFSGLVLLLSLLISPSSSHITPPQFRSSYLSVSTHFHVLINTSYSVFLSTCPMHLVLPSLIFSLMVATPALALTYSFPIFSIIFIPIIHLNILISMLPDSSFYSFDHTCCCYC